MTPLTTLPTFLVHLTAVSFSKRTCQILPSHAVDAGIVHDTYLAIGCHRSFLASLVPTAEKSLSFTNLMV